MSQNQYPQRVKTALDATVMKLYADPIEGSGGKSPTLLLYFINNNPRIDVWTQIPNDKDKGLIRAKIGPKQLYQIRYFLNKLINNPTDENVYTIGVKSHRWNQRENRKDKEATQTECIYIGRSKEGELFISVMSSDNSRPKIRFPFREDRYHPLGQRSGVFPAAEQSNVSAYGWIETIASVYAVLLATEYQHEDRSQQSGGKGGGNNNNRSSGGGNNSSSSNDYGDEDDDLPFD